MERKVLSTWRAMAGRGQGVWDTTGRLVQKVFRHCRKSIWKVSSVLTLAIQIRLTYKMFLESSGKPQMTLSLRCPTSLTGLWVLCQIQKKTFWTKLVEGRGNLLTNWFAD